MGFDFNLDDTKEDWYQKTQLQNKLAYHIMLTRHLDALFFQLMKLPHEMPDVQTSTFVGTKYEDIEKSYINGATHIYQEMAPLREFISDKLNEKKWLVSEYAEATDLKTAQNLVGWLYKLAAASSLLFELEVEEHLPEENIYVIPD